MMTFFVKKSEYSEIEGPLTMALINRMVRQKQLTSDSLAIPDRGQSVKDATSEPLASWMKLSDVKGFEPDPEVERKYVLLVLLIATLLILVPVALMVALAIILNRIH
jgi:hypothetical protein